MIDFASHWIFPVHAVGAAGPLPPAARRLQFKGPSGDRLVAIHFPPEGKPSGLLVLGFGGNAWNAQDVAEYLNEIYPAADVMSFYFRGYAPSQGTPSAEALIADAPACFDFARKHVDAKHVVAVGFSIGSGVAAALSADRKLDGVILVTPFDSLKAVAEAAVPWLPIGPWIGHEIDAAAALEKSRAKVAILAAGRDEIVPAARTDALRKRIPNLVVDKTIAGASHNSIYGRSNFQIALRSAAKRLIS